MISDLRKPSLQLTQPPTDKGLQPTETKKRAVDHSARHFRGIWIELSELDVVLATCSESPFHLCYHELTGTAPVAGAGGTYRVELHVVATEDLTTDWANGHGWDRGGRNRQYARHGTSPTDWRPRARALPGGI